MGHIEFYVQFSLLSPCWLKGRWIKISVEKYDSGVNMSAVQCGIARGPKKLQKQCNKCAKDKSEQKVSKYRSVDVARYK